MSDLRRPVLSQHDDEGRQAFRDWLGTSTPKSAR
jgi:hypothetical protein